MTYLPPRVATWRYQRGKRSLADNLSKISTSTSAIVSGDVSKESIVSSTATATATVTSTTSLLISTHSTETTIVSATDDKNTEAEDGVDNEVPIEVEDILDKVLTALGR